ncbi:HAMP domain-containing sensor histidine kinase [Acaryochloris sp. IP29b_bin.148]|uniref:sensor histidine kinase n=1 Tax=Acaryochloris sp. IP29b_bin.148 TaxID=2969218 RepID=UPI00260F682C|nr:HAMP domain-containing sensor histidine kinase [Acaryochloris sp. IP29b_bin.148]
MNRWVFPTVSEALIGSEPALDGLPALPANEGEQEWHAAIATMLSMLIASDSLAQQASHLPNLDPDQGLILTGPMPLLSGLLTPFHAWAFTPAKIASLQLPPCEPPSPAAWVSSTATIPLLPADPLAAERFCLVQTRSFSWIAVLRYLPEQEGQCQFSFVPETVQQVLLSLRSRIQLTRPHQLEAFDALLQQWPAVEPHYQIPLHFSRQLLHNYRHISMTPPANGKRSPSLIDISQAELQPPNSSGGTEDPPQPLKRKHDIDLLKALAHEVRTPLTTIQTFTQLLLKRSDLPAEVLKRLETIRRECHDQIERFSLIFRAMELANAETVPTALQLTSISVQEVLQTNIARWQKQADRRNLSFEVEVPEQLPAIAISDPTMLEQVLTGLIEQLSHRLPMGSQMQLQISLAGDQLKLELRSHQTVPQKQSAAATPMLKAIGDLLMLQPETGGLSLSLPVTKQLFEILGGKLTVRQHPQQGEVLTIFLPLGTESTAY